MNSINSYGYLQFKDEEAEALAQKLFKIPNLHVNFDRTQKISKEDIQSILDLVEKLKNRPSSANTGTDL